MKKSNRNFINCKPILSDVDDLLWFEPREIADQFVPQILTPEDQEKYGVEYYYGMFVELHAFISGLIRKKRPSKILEVGVDRGGSSVVLLQAIKSLGLEAKLYSVDINPNLPAAISSENVEKWVPHLIENWNLRYGRDVAAYLEEIGDEIDFCIIDTAHCMPGEVLNFLCILPYLKNGATVVIDDQLIPFKLISDFPLETLGRARIKETGASSMISCKVLLDCVVAEKLVPNLPDIFGESDRTQTKIPNIASFEISEKTRSHVNDLFSALLLPWQFIPSRQTLLDVQASLTLNYPAHSISYFKQVLDEQINFHSDIKNLDDRTRAYWRSLLECLAIGEQDFAFYGGGNYCRKLIENWLPDSLLPVAIFDTTKTTTFSIGPIKIFNLNEIGRWANIVSKIVITSPAYHEEISSMLETKFLHEEICVEIIDPFESPKGQTIPTIRH